MTMAAKTTGAVPAAFVPSADERAPRHGRRREFETVPSRPLRWPTTIKAQKELFDAWHQIAMQIVHTAGASFRLMAVIERFVNWQSGELWPSNETLARRAGGCGESTVKRDMAAYQKIGLLSVELGCRRQRNGRLVRKRTIRLSVPDSFQGQIDEPSEGVMRGPDGDFNHQVMRGPPEGVMRGPDTLEDTLEDGAEEDL